MKRPSLLEILDENYNRIDLPNSSIDPRLGHGYGTLKPKGRGSQYQYAAGYPYKDLLQYDIDDDEIDEFVKDYLSPEMITTISNKIGSDAIPSDLPVSRRRVDRSAFVGSDTRLNFYEVNSLPKIKKGIAPFSFKTLYKKWDGPALGGTATNQAYTVAPGRRGGPWGSKDGWSHSPKPNPADAVINVFNPEDIFHHEDLSLEKARLQVRRILDMMEEEELEEKPTES